MFSNIKKINMNPNQKRRRPKDESDENEKKEIVQEAKQIVDLKELVTSILFISDLSRQRE